MKTSRVHLLIALPVFFGAVIFAHAQTSTPTTSIPITDSTATGTATSSELLPGNQAQPVENVAAQAGHSKPEAVLSESKQKRVVNLAANISNGVDAAVRRLNNIANRLDKRIEKLETSGVDATEAKANLAEARKTLSNLSDRMDTIDTIVYQSVTSETPRATWQNVKAIFEGVRGDLNAAREALRATVAALKQAILETQLNQGASEAVESDETTSELAN